MATISSPRPPSAAGTSRMQSPYGPQSPSDSPTPASSVRASLDLPTANNVRSSSPAPGPAAATQRRNRAALRDYYNLKSKPPGPPNLSRTASIASTASIATVTSTAVPDPRASTDLDSPSTSISTAALDDPSFEAEPYITSLLSTSNLKTVLRAEATLISEIRNLDGERKALVYDNYSKLIKASKTIGGMRMNMNMNGDGERRGVVQTSGGLRERRSGGLSTDGMRDLGDRIEGVRRLTEEVGRGGLDGEGQAERKKVNEERKKRQLVKWVLDGPHRLRKRVQDGQIQEAEAEWKVVRGLLDKWEHVKGVKEARRACEEALHVPEAEAEAEEKKKKKKKKEEEEEEEEEENGAG